MTQLSAGPISPAVDQIVDRLDAIAQRYRVQQLLRGLACWVIAVTVATLVSATIAHFVGAGLYARVTVGVWLAFVAFATWRWFLRPLLLRPDAAVVARLIESRVDGLHNGLTNALLLAQRDDVAANPWLPEVYDEILRSTQSKPLASAVRLSDLRPLLVRMLLVLLAIAACTLIFRGPLTHGWQQLFSPAAFVPKVGDARIVSVKPGDIQLVVGKPLELTVIADGPADLGQPPMKIAFEAAPGDATTALPLPADAEALPASIEPGESGRTTYRYVYRLDRLERSIRYRVEVAGTQSDWHTASVIRQVKLQSLSLAIIPPTYLREPTKTVTLSADQIGQTPVAAPQGSEIELSALLDVPVEGAVLQVGDGLASGAGLAAAGDAAPPIAMTSSNSGRQFSARFTLIEDTPVVVLLTDAAGQVMFSVPEDRLIIAATKDAPPTIEMKWPRQDLSVSPDAAIDVSAIVRDDHGLTGGVVRVAIDLPTGGGSPPSARGAQSAEPTPLQTIAEQTFAFGAREGTISRRLEIPASARVHGAVIRVQVQATDNRDLGPAAKSAWAQHRPGDDPASQIGPQTTSSQVYQVRLQDPAVAGAADANRSDQLRKLLSEMLAAQKALLADTVEQTGRETPPGARASSPAAAEGGSSPLLTPPPAAAGEDARAPGFATIAAGQTDLRDRFRTTADTFNFAPDDRVVQKSLLMLAIGPAAEAVDLASLLQTEPAAAARESLSQDLQARQRRIIATLESLLAVLNRSPDPATQPSARRGGDLESRADAVKKLDEALKQFIAEQQKLLDQAAPLAKKPVDSFDDADKKLLEELAMAQEKLDAFMQQKVHDFSKLAEQDMANSSLLSELMEVYAEVTMAKDALKKEAVEIAVAAEDNGIALAKEISTNLEKWLPESPDRVKWTQEDPLGKNDLPLAELPKELEDLIGELLEQEEDLFEEMEDANANWHGSADKGVGWDAMDGPISNMTAKGVTGNQLPNNNEMGGRSGEGRSGKSQGEFVEDNASGKGGRRTPTRLDPTPFQQGQVKDQSTDPTGGATGGGKISGQGGQGLEGPVPPQQKEQMQRLADKQAQLRNAAERLNLQYQLGRYDNFKLLESIALMRRVEADLKANRYQTAMRRKDVLLDRMDTSRLLAGAEVHVRQDTTPTAQSKDRKDIADAMKGELPPAWKDALKAYYEKLAAE